MSEARSLLRMAPGDVLPNGAILRVYRTNLRTGDGVVLAERPGHGLHPYVVWSTYRHDPASTSGGGYYETSQAAFADLLERADRRGAL